MSEGNGNGKNEAQERYKRASRREQIRMLLLQRSLISMVERALPPVSGIKPEQLLWSAITTCETPDKDGRLPLYECEDISILRAVMKAAEVGLLFGGARADCWLLPYGREATFQMAAHGYMTLGYRAGRIRHIWCDIIYETDEYRIVRGTKPELIHEVTHSAALGDNAPYGGDAGKRGKPLFAYACAEDSNGLVLWDWVTEGYCTQARAVSRSPNSPAYSKWPDEMRKRSALVHAAKRWPMAGDMDRALELEEQAELRGELEEQLSKLRAVVTEGQAVSEQGTAGTAQQQKLRNIAAQLPTPGPSAADVIGANGADREPQPAAAPQQQRQREPGED